MLIGLTYIVFPDDIKIFSFDEHFVREMCNISLEEWLIFKKHLANVQGTFLNYSTMTEEVYNSHLVVSNAIIDPTEFDETILLNLPYDQANEIKKWSGILYDFLLKPPVTNPFEHHDLVFVSGVSYFVSGLS